MAGTISQSDVLQGITRPTRSKEKLQLMDLAKSQRFLSILANN
jgi:hypothetical protein